MHDDHDAFIASIDRFETVTLTFASKDDDGDTLSRVCAPLDYGPSAVANDDADRYHFWDYDSDEGPHPLVLAQDQVLSIAPTGETFDPGEFVTWTPGWHHSRDWGAYS